MDTLYHGNLKHMALRQPRQETPNGIFMKEKKIELIHPWYVQQSGLLL
jgi:hypothetical protein